MLRRLDLPQFASILDIGCGDALFFDILQHFGTPYGIEPNKNLLSDHSKWRQNIWPVPFDRDFDTEQRFDLILMLDVLEHIDDDVDAIQRAVHLLKPGGIVLLTVPALMSLWTDHDEINQHKKRYTQKSLQKAIQTAGIHCERCRYYFVWAALPKWIIHWKERFMGAPEKSLQTHIPNAFINRTLIWISRWDHQLFHHLPMPFGASLIAIGRQ